MKAIPVIGSLIFQLTISFYANGQIQEKLSVAEKKQKTVVTEPLTVYKGYFRTGLSGTYNVLDKWFTAAKKKEPLPGDGWGRVLFTDALFQYGITDRLMVEVAVPFNSTSLTISSYDEFPFLIFDTLSIWKRSSTGLGDVRVTSGFQIIPETPFNSSLASFLTLTIPTGRKNPKDVDPDNPRIFKEPAGYGEYSLSALIKYRKITYPFSFNAFLAYEYHFPGEKILKPTDTLEKPFQSGFLVNVGGAVHMMLNDWIAFKNYMDFFAFGKGTSDGEKDKEGKWIIQYTPGLSFQLKQFRIDQYISIPLKGKSVGADIGYSITTLYVF